MNTDLRLLIHDTLESADLLQKNWSGLVLAACDGEDALAGVLSNSKAAAPVKNKPSATKGTGPNTAVVVSHGSNNLSKFLSLYAETLTQARIEPLLQALLKPRTRGCELNRELGLCGCMLSAEFGPQGRMLSGELGLIVASWLLNSALNAACNLSKCSCILSSQLSVIVASSFRPEICERRAT